MLGFRICDNMARIAGGGSSYPRIPLFRQVSSIVFSTGYNVSGGRLDNGINEPRPNGGTIRSIDREQFAAFQQQLTRFFRTSNALRTEATVPLWIDETHDKSIRNMRNLIRLAKR